MKELKKEINEVLAQTAVDITELTGCFMLWGEVELFDLEACTCFLYNS